MDLPDNFGGVSRYYAIVRESSMYHAPRANNHIVSDNGTFKDYRVHTDETVVANKNRRAGSMLFIEIQASLFRVKRVEVVIDNLAVGSDGDIFTYFD